MWSVLSAPSNLGLRPPEPDSVPGCSKAPEALREAGLHARLAADGAVEAGVVLAGRYVDDGDPTSGRVRNQDGIVEHARRLADRLEAVLAAGQQALVLGGDCSILVGAGLALRRRGRYGLVHIDGHTDFRHPGNSEVCLSLAGEDLAAAVGLHWPAISDIDGYAPYFSPTEVVHIGCRDDDEFVAEVRRTIGAVIPSRAVIEDGVDSAALAALAVVEGREINGYWLHLDVDVLDPAHLRAVDSPDPGGLSPDQLVDLLRRLAPGAAGLQVTVYDPDLDPDGSGALLLTDILVEGLR
jgi:arginase